MKKSIIALAVLAAGFAQADGTTLYGTFESEYTLDYAKGVDRSITGVAADKATDARGHLDNNVLLGIKGSDELGNGMKAFYSIEWDKFFDNENATWALDNQGVNQRTNNDGAGANVKLGLETGFGTFIAGNNDLPSDAVGGDQVDFFEELGSKGRTDSAVGSADHSLAYASPKFSGFQVVAGAVLDDDVSVGGSQATGNGTTDKDGNRQLVDAYDVSAVYSANGIYAGAGYLATTADPSVAQTLSEGQVTLAGGYSNDMFAIGAKTAWVDEFKYGSFVVAGKYNVMPNASVYADFGGANDKTGDDYAVGLGGSYAFDDKLSAYGEYRFTHAKNDANGNARGDDFENNSEVALGAKYKFSKQTESWAKYQYNDGFSVKDAESHQVKLGLKSSF